MAATLTISKPKTVKKIYTERIREKIAAVMSKRAEEMLHAQMDAAIGVTTEKYDRKTGDLYYIEEGPNVAAARLLLEYSLGKPTDKKEISIKGGIVHLISSLEQDEDTHEV